MFCYCSCNSPLRIIVEVTVQTTEPDIRLTKNLVKEALDQLLGTNVNVLIAEQAVSVDIIEIKLLNNRGDLSC